MNHIDQILVATGIPVIYIKIVLGVLVSYFLCMKTIPTVIKISYKKNLMDEPGMRSSHIRKIPNLGGISIFYSIGICAPIFAYELFDLYKFLFPALVILLYVGVMDDVMMMRAYKKLIIQIVVTVMVVFGSDVRIRSLFGLFGIEQLNYWFSVILTVVTFIILINAFNLIDGIDGLAGGYVLLCSALFAASYFWLGKSNYPLVVLCSIIIGALAGFMYYNLSNGNKKIFMGDTGSLILGFLLSFTSICFLNIFVEDIKPGVPKYFLLTAPAIAVAILILPIVDTLNVIIVRIYRKKSPFIADKNHIHHKLLKLGFSHKKATLTILGYYLFIIAITYFLRHIEVNTLLMIVVVLGFIGAYLPDLFYKKTNDIKKYVKIS